VNVVGVIIVPATASAVRGREVGLPGIAEHRIRQVRLKHNQVDNPFRYCAICAVLRSHVQAREDDPDAVTFWIEKYVVHAASLPEDGKAEDVGIDVTLTDIADNDLE
jgi:hypothetical protein